MCLFYPYTSSSGSNSNDARDNITLVHYADASNLFDPHKGLSQSGYVFAIGNTTIFYRSCKQNLVATSTNHYELLALYEASRDCVWLRAVIGRIRSTCDLDYDPNEPVVIYKDNTIVIDQENLVTSKGIKLNTSHQKFSLNMNCISED